MKKSIKEILRPIIQEIIKEYYQPKVDKEKESITFVNDAEVKKAKATFAKKKIEFSISGKTIKFPRSVDFKNAQKVVK